MIRHLLFTLLLLVIDPTVTLAQEAGDLTGEVVEVRDDHGVRIDLDGDWLPNVGDAVRIRFRDEVPGAGVVVLDGTWTISEVGEADAWAMPEGETARPQVGQLALIASDTPRPAVTDASSSSNDDPPPPTEEVSPVSADVPERPAQRRGRRIIDRRRYFALATGASLLSVGESLHGNIGEDQPYSYGLHTFGGILLTRSVAVGGMIRWTGATTPGGFTGTLYVHEIVYGPGLTLYVGPTPGNVPGDVSFFANGAYAFIDISTENLAGPPGEADERYTGAHFGGGLIVTIRRGMGVYLMGTYTTPVEESPFERGPFEVGVGMSIFL